MALGMGLLYGPRGECFLMSGVPLDCEPSRAEVGEIPLQGCRADEDQAH